MQIVRMADNIWMCENDGDDFNVGYLEGQLYVYWNEGNQVFQYKGPLTKESLNTKFINRDAALRAALYHTRGILNRSRFKQRAQELFKNGEVVAEQLSDLIGFIETCDCPPIKALEKLISKGYAAIAGKLDFYDESPTMKESIDKLLLFMEHFDEKS